jgi:hypothetical protein
MKVQVHKIPIAKLKLDIIKFEKDFKKNLNLKSAAINNFSIIECSDEIKSNIKDFVYMSIDWGNIFMLYDVVDKTDQIFSVYKCSIEGLTVYNPSAIDPVDGVFEFNDEVVNKAEFLVVGKYNPRIDKHIEFMLSQKLIDYVNFDWKMLFKMD